MCETKTLATAGIGAQSGGAAYSAVGAFYNSKAQKVALNGAAQLADINAQLSELEAQGALVSGQRKEQASKLDTAQLKSKQKVAFAANGIDLGSQTAVNVLTTTDVLGEIDADTIKADALKQAWGYRTQGMNFTNDALMKRSSSKAISPSTAGITSLLTSASSIGTNYYLAKKAGAFD